MWIYCAMINKYIYQKKRVWVFLIRDWLLIRASFWFTIWGGTFWVLFHLIKLALVSREGQIIQSFKSNTKVYLGRVNLWSRKCRTFFDKSAPHRSRIGITHTPTSCSFPSIKLIKSSAADDAAEANWIRKWVAGSRRPPRRRTKAVSFKKWANPGLFYHLFLIFSNKHHYYFYNKYMWKKYRFNIWCRDLNPQPLARESPPITTRPGSFLPRSSTTVTTATTTPMLSFVKKFFILKIRPSLDSPFLKVENDRGHCFDDTHESVSEIKNED